MKGQTALEYLMTYGWAILIIVIVVGALYALGLTSPCKFVGTQVSGFADFQIPTSGVKLDTTANTLAFDLSRLKPDTVTLSSIAVSGDATGSLTTSQSVNSTAARYTVSGLTTSKKSGDCYASSVTLTYNVTTAGGAQSFTSSGKISGVAS